MNVIRCCSCRRIFKAASDRLFVRNYSIIPPDWLGGNIGKQIEGPPLEEWKNYQEKMEGNGGNGRVLCHPHTILSPTFSCCSVGLGYAIA